MKIAFSILLLFTSLYVGALESDTLLVLRYFNASEEEIGKFDYKAARLCNDSAFLASRLTRDNRYNDILYQQRGIVFLRQQMYDSALLCLNKSLVGKSRNSNKQFLAKSIFHIGKIYCVNTEKDSALSKLNNSVELYGELNDIEGVCKSILAKGLLYTNMKVYDTAMFYYVESLELASENNLNEVKMQSLINIANIYVQSGKYAKARGIFDDAYEICNQINDSVNKATIAINRAATFLYEGDIDKALEGFEQELNAAIKVNDKSTIGLLNSNIGIIYMKKKEYQKALRYLYGAIVIYDEFGNSNELAKIYLSLGSVYKKMGQYSKSHQCYQQAISMSAKTNTKEIRGKAYRNIARLYAKQNKYEDAYLTMILDKKLRDSIYDENQIKYLLEYQAKFDKLKDEEIILKLENEKIKDEVININLSYQRNAYIGGLLLVSVMLFFIVWFNWWRNKKNQLINEQKLIQLENEKNLANANSVIEGEEKERKRIAQELHDGIGVLLSTASVHFSNVEDKADKGISEMTHKAKLLLDRASNEIRHISHNMMPGVLSKFGIYEAMTDIFEELDEDTDIKTTFIIEGEKRHLHENAEIMIFRIVQEMVNNTIKHSEANEVVCKVIIEGDNVSISYSDNGCGFDLEKIGTKTSFGLNGIHSRVKFLNGEIRVESAHSEGTKYFIKVSV